ncbi:hypothetical protein AB4138_06830 [Vibrio sp. 10N.286.52.C3]|uniref:hypothetical protein n=1 Tax=Vibrio TaxID=662 RepID=UPI003550D3BF
MQKLTLLALSCILLLGCSINKAAEEKDHFVDDYIEINKHNIKDLPQLLNAIAFEYSRFANQAE